MFPEHNDPRSFDSDPAMEDLDTLKRDRFELLSAYLDSEVTAPERKQVEQWLATDPEMQRLYARLLKLRHRLQNMPIPVPQESVDQTIEQVFTRIDRRPQRRLILAGLSATAAVVIGALSSLVGSDRGFSPQFAQDQAPQDPVATGIRPSEPADPSALMVALDRPPVEIPKADEPSGLELDWQRNLQDLQ